MKTDFQYKSRDLSEEHIKHICRFLKLTYVKGEYQKWSKFSQFKFWHKSEMDKRDAELALKRKESIKFLNP